MRTLISIASHRLALSGMVRRAVPELYLFGDYYDTGCLLDTILCTPREDDCALLWDGYLNLCSTEIHFIYASSRHATRHFPHVSCLS